MGGVAAIHAEDNDIVMFMYEKLMRENRVGFEHMAEVHNTLSEELSFNRVIRLAERVEGAALYMVHVSRPRCGGAGCIAGARLPDVWRNAAPGTRCTQPRTIRNPADKCIIPTRR